MLSWDDDSPPRTASWGGQNRQYAFVTIIGPSFDHDETWNNGSGMPWIFEIPNGSDTDTSIAHFLQAMIRLSCSRTSSGSNSKVQRRNLQWQFHILRWNGVQMPKCGQRTVFITACGIFFHPAPQGNCLQDRELLLSLIIAWPHSRFETRWPRAARKL